MKSSKIISICVLAASGVIGFGAHSLQKQLSDKVLAQEAATTSFEQWQQDSKTLLPLQKQWKDTYLTAADIKDHFSVLKRLDLEGRYGVHLDTDRFTLTQNIGPYQFQGKSMGLIRVCVGNGEPILKMTAPSHEQLIKALQQMGERPDFVFDAAQLTQEKEPTLILSNPCLLVREV